MATHFRPPLRKLLMSSFSSGTETSSHSNVITNLRILHEDDHLIVVNKRPNMLSVPGRIKEFLKTRGDEWLDAIKHAAASEASESKLASDMESSFLHRLSKLSAVPRKESRFYYFLEKSMKLLDLNEQRRLWNVINETDARLNKTPFSSIPEHMISETDAVEQYCKHKIYVVHRLDMETSGILLFAKSEVSCAELSRQFRDREVLLLPTPANYR